MNNQHTTSYKRFSAARLDGSLAALEHSTLQKMSCLN